MPHESSHRRLSLPYAKAPVYGAVTHCHVLRGERRGGSFLEGLWIEGDQGLQQRALLVVGVDAVEMVLDHFASGGRAFAVREVELLDGDFFDGDGLSVERAQKRAEQEP
jgi:hypothetical protein